MNSFGNWKEIARQRALSSETLKQCTVRFKNKPGRACHRAKLPLQSLTIGRRQSFLKQPAIRILKVLLHILKVCQNLQRLRHRYLAIVMADCFIQTTKGGCCGPRVAATILTVVDLLSILIRQRRSSTESHMAEACPSFHRLPNE